MKTKELPIFSIQSNMLGAVLDKNTCKVLLSNGNYLLIKCPTDIDANNIKNAIMYYPITEGRENNAKEFEFDFELVYEKM